MGVNKVSFGGNTLIDLTGDTLESAEQLLKGIIAHAKDGSVITGLMEAGGGEMDTIFGHSFEYGSITPNEDITSDYTIEFSRAHRSPNDSAYYNFVMWCDTSNEDAQNLSWLWLITGRKKTNGKFSYGQYITSNGEIGNASYSGVIGFSSYSTQFTIYCTSSKKLLAGRKYNWIVVGNEV